MSMTSIPLWLYVLVGGGIGSLLRFWLSMTIQAYAGAYIDWVPMGTLAVNLLGCFLIGALAGMPEGHQSLPPQIRLFLITGFLGGLTTFSTYAFESFLLLRGGSPEKALWNLCGSVILGMLVLMVGFYLTKTWAWAK